MYVGLLYKYYSEANPIQVLFKGKYNTFRFMVIQKKLHLQVYTHTCFFGYAVWSKIKFSITTKSNIFEYNSMNFVIVQFKLL